MGERNKRTKLKKSMGPGSIWAVAVGSIIGWGCFIQGGLWTERAGGPLPLFLGFLAGGLLMIVVGYSYSYMIAKFPVAGGEFAYAYKGFGRTASYICGWMLSLGYLSIVALNATALPVLASYIFPGVFNRGYLYTIAGYDVYMGEVGLSLFFIILFGYCTVKVVFSNIKRGGIMLCQIAVGSLYLFGIPRGSTDGFYSWCKQVIATCLTAFLQTTILYLGLLTYTQHALLAVGICLSATEVPRIAQMYGLDTSVRVNMMSVSHTVSMGARAVGMIKGKT